MAGFIGPLIGLGTSIFNGIQNQNAQQWDQGAMMNLLNSLKGGGDAANTSMNVLFDYLRGNSYDQLNRGNQFLYGNENGPGALTGLGDDLSTLYNNRDMNMFRYGWDPSGYEGNLNSMLGMMGNMDPLMQSLGGNVANGGRGYDGGMLRDRIMDNVNGQGAMDSFRDIGQDLLGQRGQTNMTRNLTDRSMDVLSAGGGNSSTNALGGMGFDLMGNGSTDLSRQLAMYGGNTLDGYLGVGGLTPTGAQGELVALEGLSQGGENNLTRLLASTGMDKASRESILPMGMAANMAREEATNSYQKMAEKQYGRALNRGGGPGAVVANGLQNQAMADFADQGAQGASSAFRDALLKQQQLGLQENQIGSQMALGGGGLAANRLGEFSNLLRGLEGVASSRFGIGGGMLGNAANLESQRQGMGADWVNSALGNELNRVGTYGNLGIQGGNQDIARMGLGGNLLNDFYGVQNSGMQNLLGQLGMENQFNLGSGQLMNNVNQGNAGFLQNVLGGQLAQGNLGLNQQNSYYDWTNDLLGQRGQQANRGFNIMQMGIDPMLQMGGNFANLYGNMYNSLPNIFSGNQTRNPFAEALGFAGAGLSKLFPPGTDSGSGGGGGYDGSGAGGAGG